MSQSDKKMWLDGIFEEEVQTPPIILCSNFLYCANPRCLNRHFDEFSSRMCMYQHYNHFHDKNFIMEEEKKALDKEIMRFKNSGDRIVVM